MSYNIALEMETAPPLQKSAPNADVSKVKTIVIPFVFVAVFAGLIAFDRLAVPHLPFSPDAGAYATISQELLQGKTLYSEIWDHKPPAIFLTYGAAEIIFGYEPHTIVILNLFINLVVLLGIYYAGKNGRGGIVAGLFSAALWVILTGTFEIEGRDTNSEVFINACVIWAFALLTRNACKNLETKHILLIGLLLALGSIYKPVVIVIALFLACAHLIFPPGGAESRKKALKDVLIIGAVGFLSWAALFVYFGATGRFELFYKTIVSYNSHYSGNLLTNMIAPFHGRTEFFPDFLNPVAALAFAGIIFTFIHNRRLGAMLAAFAASTWIAIALPGHFYQHYFQLWLPPLIVGAGWAIGHFAVSVIRPVRLASFVAGAVLIAITIAHQVQPYRAALAKDFSKFANPPLVAADETAQKINHLLAPGETFFLWGNTPNLYFLTKRKPPAAIIFQQHLSDSPVSEFLKQRVSEDLARTKPELVVAESGKTAVPEWILKDYEPMQIYLRENTYTFYMRRGGRLAKEIQINSIK